MPHILIAGAGIGGLTAALALAKVGAAVSVLEPTAVLEEAGAGLQISPNAGRILMRLGLLDALAAVSFSPAGIRVRSARSGRALSFMPLRDAERRWGAPYLVAHRADLQRVLLTAVTAEPAIDLHLGTALAGFGTTEDGVAVTVKQGLLKRAFEGDALIGADGVRSAVRARLVGDGADPPLETGRTAWRALVEADAVDPIFRAAETGLWLGRDAHLVHYPLRDSRHVNVVAITRDTTGTDARDLWSAAGDPEVIKARFAAWSAAPRGLIAAAGAWKTWPLFDRAPLPAWNAGPIALLGDAAHPILPFLAQGAAQAIEDADALAAAVAGTRSMPDALARYSQNRLARATKVQETSRQLGRIYHLAGPAALARDAAMRLLGPRRLLARYDWLYASASNKRDIQSRDSLRLTR